MGLAEVPSIELSLESRNVGEVESDCDVEDPEDPTLKTEGSSLCRELSFGIFLCFASKTATLEGILFGGSDGRSVI